MFRKWPGIILALLGAVLLGAALLLSLHNEEENMMAGQAAASAMTGIQQAMQGRETLPEETVPVLAAEPETVAELTVLNIDGHDYCGYLTIPDFNLELPIMAECSMENMRYAPCLQSGSPLADDAVIAGHNFKTHFLALHDIQPGQTVTFTDLDGEVISYTVAKKKTIDPRSVEEVTNSRHDLTLYTCTIGGQSRVVVFCDRTAEKK